MPLDQFTFRHVVAADLGVLVEWHRRPHVLEWWPDPPTARELQEYCRAADAGGANPHGYIAMHEHFGAAGFIQAYRAAAGHDEGWWLDEKDWGVLGIDQYLADPARLGQGLGTAMIRAFVAKLLDDPSVSRIQTDPDPRNHRAIRSYQKAGFRASGEVDTPDGRALLMYRDR